MSDDGRDDPASPTNGVLVPQAPVVWPQVAAARERQAANKQQFLEVFAKEGTIQEACDQVGVARRTVHAWRTDDPVFADAFIDAQEAATDALEAECRRRAKDGVEEPVYYQGEEVGTVRKYSDLCLLALLNAYRSQLFKHRHEHTGRDGGPIAVVQVSYDVNMKPDDMP